MTRYKEPFVYERRKTCSMSFAAAVGRLRSIR